MMHANFQDTLVGGTLGFTYGFVLNKTGAYKTRLIRSAFEGRDLTLFKTFGTSIAVGTVGMAVTHALGYTDIRVKPTYLWGNLIGGALVGGGTYLAGSSLEACLGQLGACKRRGAFALAGGLTGALVYGLMDTTIRGTFLGESGGALALHTMLDLPFAYVALPFAGLVAGVVYLMEKMSPSRKEIAETKPEGLMESAVACLEKSYWNPYACGAVIGLLQIPTCIEFGNAFGVAAPYFSIAASAAGVAGMTSVLFELYKMRDVYWTFPLDFGTIVGSWASNEMSKKKKTPTEKAVVPLTSSQKACTFAGTFLVAVGSGMAAGSPSVHGLSGVSQLSIGSMLTMAGVLGGGVITAAMLTDKRADI